MAAFMNFVFILLCIVAIICLVGLLFLGLLIHFIGKKFKQWKRKRRYEEDRRYRTRNYY